MRRLFLATALLGPWAATAREPPCRLHERPACAEGFTIDLETGYCVPIVSS